MKTTVRLWDYACQLYDRPSVQQACMILQDAYGVNTPLLLYCCWRLQYDGYLGEHDLQLAKKQLEAIDKPLITPLRQIRRAMKADKAFAEAHWQELRQALAKQELTAERLLLEALEDLTLSEKGASFTSLSNAMELLYPEVFSTPSSTAQQNLKLLSSELSND